MRKITLHVLLLVFASYGMMAQNLLSNGDFESGMVDWTGNAFNVQTEGGNSFNFANVEVAGNAFDVNLSQITDIVMGQTYTLTFDAGTDDATSSRTLIAGIGLNEAPFTADIETVTIASGALQTFELTFTASFGLMNSRVLFDMGAETGVIVIDNVSLELAEGGSTFDGGLVDNGDFEEGMIEWTGNAFNVQTDGGNSFNFANVEAAGNSFDVNLSQVLEIVAGETYTMSFDAATGVGQSRSIIAGIGLNEAPFTSNTEVVALTEDIQTFELTFTADFGMLNSRVLFDMGAEVGVVVIDNVSLFLEESDGITPPDVAAPTPPARDADAVFSIYSDAYTDQPDVIFGAFNVGTTDITPLVVEEDNFLQINFVQPDPGFLLVDWGTIVDNTDLTHFHMDIWVDTDLTTGLVVNPILSNHVGDAGETSNFGLTNPVNTFGEWISIDLPMDDFDFGTTPGVQQRDALRQFVMTVAGADAGPRTVFLDNLYLHNDTLLSTEEFSTINITAFPNPSRNNWTISANSQTITSVEVYDILGQRVATQNPNSTDVTIDASRFTTGMYIATINTNEGSSSVKLIKN
jgi:endoglucanase